MASSTRTKNLSRAELLKRRAQLDAERSRIDAEISAQSQAELHGLVEAFKKHLKENDFDLNDALALLGPGKKDRVKRGTVRSKPSTDRPKPGVTYRHPTTGEEWAAPINLRRVKKWLVELVQTSGKRYEDFAAKK